MFQNLTRLLSLLSTVNTTNYIGVVSPGYNVKPEAYINITKAIVSKAESLNIGVDMFIANVTQPTLSNYKNALNDVFDYIHSVYDTNSEIFFVGHSEGAFFGMEHSIKYSNYTIQIGSVLNSAGKLFWDKGNLLSYPRPIMTILGENDGFLPWTLGNYEINSINEFINNFGYNYISRWKPVVILEGLNHMAVADNKITESAKAHNKKDMNCSYNLNTIHIILSNYIINFITQNTSSIIIDLDNTRKKLKMYNKISDKAFINEKISYLQNVISNNVYKVYNIFHTNFDNFIYSKPHQTDLGFVTQTYIEELIPIKQTGIVTQSYINYTDRYNFQDHLWLKMKKGSNIIKANYINSYIYDSIYKKLTKQERDKYDKYGKKLFFGEDIHSLNWITQKLKVHIYDSNVTIDSPVLLTNDTVPERYKNMYYVKILTPAQIYNWFISTSFV